MLNIIMDLVKITRAQWVAFVIKEFALDRQQVWRAFGYSSEHDLRRELYLYDDDKEPNA